MPSIFISWIRGYVKLQVKGRGAEGLLNEMIDQHFSIWDIRVTEEKTVMLSILLKDFFRLRPLLKRTSCRMHVLERYGFPFIMDKLGTRKIFIGGFAGFIIGLYLLSSLVWQISVEGNERISDSDILQAASKQGIHRFQWKFRLPDGDVLSKQLQNSLPGTAWVGVEIRGTHFTIKVVESTITDPKQLMNPRNLVASKNALVTEIIADKGRPMVKPNTFVRKGDVLISGVIGDEQNKQIVVASGKVKGIVWYVSHIETPLTQTYKVYTGERKSRNYLVLGTRALQLTGYGKLNYLQYETIPNRFALHWRNYSLPFGWLHEAIMEVREEHKPIDPAEAKMNGLEQARAELRLTAGADSKHISEKILHEKTENGKIYMEAYFEVEEWITEEQPIVIQN
jgi:similar to stage IV sporulation protein